MPTTQTNFPWEANSSQKYKLMIAKLPLFHREIAKQVVDKKAVQNAKDRGAKAVEEGDIVRAFFSEVPKAFYSLMVRLFEEVGFNYRQYEGN
jgi:hypothetical protein